MKRNLKVRKGRFAASASNVNKRKNWASKILEGSGGSDEAGRASRNDGSTSSVTNVTDGISKGHGEVEMQAAMLRRQYNVVECRDGEIFSALHTYSGDVKQAALICERIARQRRSDFLNVSDSQSDTDSSNDGQSQAGGPADLTLEPGRPVWLVGLAGRKMTLNGKQALIVNYQPSTGRYIVQLVEEGEQNAILPHNLSDTRPPVDPAPSSTEGNDAGKTASCSQSASLAEKGHSGNPYDPQTRLAASLYSRWTGAKVSLNPKIALPQVNRQARRLSGLPVDTLPEFRVDVAIEDDTAKQNRLKRQMASAFLSGLTRDRRLAIADRQRQTLAVANSGRTDDSMQLTSSAAHVAHRKGEAVDQDVQIWLEQKGRREAAAEQIGFLTVSQVFYGDSVLSLPPID